MYYFLISITIIIPSLYLIYKYFKSHLKSYIAQFGFFLLKYYFKNNTKFVIGSTIEYIKSDYDNIVKLLDINKPPEIHENIYTHILKLFHSDNTNIFKINNDGYTATITFKYYSSQYQVYVPYNKNLVRKMTGTKVILFDKNGKEIDITQKPGIPYSFSAQQLGGKYIHVQLKDDIKILKEDEIPTF